MNILRFLDPRQVQKRIIDTDAQAGLVNMIINRLTRQCLKIMKNQIPDSTSGSEAANYVRCAFSSEDPQSWWRKNEKIYPNLAQAAKYYFSIQSSSVPSERMFLSELDF